MSAQIQALLDIVRGVIASPAADTTKTMIVAAIAAVVLLILADFVLLLTQPGRRKVVKVRRYRLRAGQDDGYHHPELEDGPEAGPAHAVPAPSPSPSAQSAKGKRPRKPRSRAMRLVGLWSPVLLLLAGVLSAYYVTGTDTYCAKTCHVNQETVTHAGELKHASCVSCHEQPGISGIPANVVGRFSMVAARFKGMPASTPALVDSRSCLRCHGDVLGKTVTSAGGIRMAHAQPDAAGETCTSCHPSAGHSRSRQTSMSSCVVCHDSRTASADCLTCHVNQPLATVPKPSATAVSAATTDTIGSGRIPYPLADVPSQQCTRCHDVVRQCDSCHGVRMPHSDQFKAGGHAAQASFDGKQKCWKCHQTTDCSKCHPSFDSGHPANWAAEHQKQPWSASGCACHNKSPLGTGCYVCHSKTPPHALLR